MCVDGTEPGGGGVNPSLEGSGLQCRLHLLISFNLIKVTMSLLHNLLRLGEQPWCTSIWLLQKLDK